MRAMTHATADSPQTLIEKIATAHAVDCDGPVVAGDIVNIRPRHIMTHDNTSAVMGKFKSIFAGGSGAPSREAESHQGDAAR